MNQQKLFPDDLAKRIMDSGCKKYRPSNGTEGMMFMDMFCEQCAKYSSDETDADCEIMAKTFWLDESDADYPAEWTYKDGQPVCTAFVQMVIE
jgi:hypothetical protein